MRILYNKSQENLYYKQGSPSENKRIRRGQNKNRAKIGVRVCNSLASIVLLCSILFLPACHKNEQGNINVDVAKQVIEKSNTNQIVDENTLLAQNEETGENIKFGTDSSKLIEEKYSSGSDFSEKSTETDKDPHLDSVYQLSIAELIEKENKKKEESALSAEDNANNQSDSDEQQNNNTDNSITINGQMDDGPNENNNANEQHKQNNENIEDANQINQENTNGDNNDNNTINDENKNGTTGNSIIDAVNSTAKPPQMSFITDILDALTPKDENEQITLSNEQAIAETNQNTTKSMINTYVDLSGRWTQMGVSGDGDYMVASIGGNNITTAWVVNGSQQIYWSGTYTDPCLGDDLPEWHSIRNKNVPAMSVCISNEPEKEFVYYDGVIYFNATYLDGKSVLVTLTKTSD